MFEFRLMKKSTIFLIAATVLFFSNESAALPKKILLVGNSLTSTNGNVIRLYQKLALSAIPPETVITDWLGQGGKELSWWAPGGVGYKTPNSNVSSLGYTCSLDSILKVKHYDQVIFQPYSDCYVNLSTYPNLN